MELYSKRRKLGESPLQAYRYDLPLEFKNQVLHIWTKSIGFIASDHRGSLAYEMSLGNMSAEHTYRSYERINRILCEEHGLVGLHGDGPCRALYEWFVKSDVPTALDIIQVSFHMIGLAQQNHEFMVWVSPELSADGAVAKLNERFQEHAIGYRLEQGRIIEIGSEFLHQETTKQAFQLMHVMGFDGALEEFHLAHKHYRQGEEHYDDCLTNCLKALESTLKTICNRRKWAYNPNDTASRLLDVVFKNNLIPNYLQTHFAGLRSTLEAGVPTIRNREGGHGSGEKPNEVPEYLAAYQLHLTASSIVLLITAHDALGKSI